VNTITVSTDKNKVLVGISWQSITYRVWVGLLFGCVLQSMVIVFFIRGLFVESIVCHVLTALVFPWFLWQFMPHKLHQSALILSLLFLFCLFVPLVSGVGLFISLALGVYFAKPIDEDITDVVQDVTMTDKELQHAANQVEQSRNVLAILETSEQENQRIQAVLSTRFMLDKDAIPILRIALLDPLDEVRLLAYSMLDKKEKSLGKTIKAQLQEVDDTLSKSQAVVHRRLAEAYWELSYLGLVQGQAKTQILKRAFAAIEQVTQIEFNNAESFFLKGRIALNMGLNPVAEVSFQRAIELGVPRYRVASYQAELAFVQHQYEQVSDYLSLIDDETKKNEIILEIVKQWS